MINDNLFVFSVRNTSNKHVRRAIILNKKKIEIKTRNVKRRRLNHNQVDIYENVFSNSNSIQTQVFTFKRSLKHVIPTINNNILKKNFDKNETRLETKKKKNSIRSRVEFQIVSFNRNTSTTMIQVFRSIKRAFERIATRTTKQKIEQSNQKNEIDFIKKNLEKLIDDEFVRIFQFDTFSFSQLIESTSISSSESISINRNVQRKNDIVARKTRRRDERNLDMN